VTAAARRTGTDTAPKRPAADVGLERLKAIVTMFAYYGASASTRVCAEMILTGPRRPEGRSGESALYRETLAQVTR
jgi:hypothetical protein